MPPFLAATILTAAGVYASIGVLVGGWFVFRSIARIDHAAANAPVGFRFLVWPGAAALWPWVVHRAIVSNRSAEEHAHDA
ncbi:MAG: hypothetical protein KF805_00300 [Phycisphaeraceae bacterium]|nr:hypothetical protein [Phycisphaeraceae bacterium]